MLQTAPAWLVNLALYWFCVRPVLQFVQFSPFEPCPPIHLQFPLTQHYVSRFEKQTLFIIQVSNESNEQCQAKTDSYGTQNQEAQFTPPFDSKLPVTTEPCFQPVWYFHLTMFFFLAYKKLSQKPMENQDIRHLLLVLVSMVRITSSNDEIRCFDAVCSSESHDFSFQYLWIMACLIFPVFFQELKKAELSLIPWFLFKKREKTSILFALFHSWYLSFLERTINGSEITSGNSQSILSYNSSRPVQRNIIGFFMPFPTTSLLILDADHTALLWCLLCWLSACSWALKPLCRKQHVVFWVTFPLSLQ